MWLKTIVYQLNNDPITQMCVLSAIGVVGLVLATSIMGTCPVNTFC